MPLSIHRLPCYVCKSAADKPIVDSNRKERLTRCIGSAYLIKFYSEGIIQDEVGCDVVAEWVSDRTACGVSFTCNSTEGQRYFHQSCLGRDQAGPLSYDNKYYHFRGTEESGKQPELRNITHKCCEDCLAAAQASAPQEDRMRQIKYNGALGVLQL